MNDNLETLRKFRYSRYPVFDGDCDQVIGIITGTLFGGIEDDREPEGELAPVSGVRPQHPAESPA